MNKVCKNPNENIKYEPFTLVIFGGAGDLAKKKLLPSLYRLYSQGHIAEKFKIISFGHPKIDRVGYINIVEEVIKKQIKGGELERVEDFLTKFDYIYSSFDQSENYEELAKVVASYGEERENLIFYLAIPPVFNKEVVANLQGYFFCSHRCNRKIVVEKPFGTNLSSAKELNRILHEVFKEEEIYRMDHYLGKETVQNILFFRFANSIFEPLWNRNYIEYVEITVAEDIGIGTRGKFYEKSGIIRDIIQNHMLQLLALVAMEAPIGINPEYIRDEKVKVFRTIKGMDSNYIDKNIVVAQYGGGKDTKAYRKEGFVSEESVVPTYFAGKVELNNWRWEGVPFYLRSGKRLKRKATEIFIKFKKPPLEFFGGLCDDLVANAIIISIQPDETISVRLNSKFPGSSNYSHPVTMDFNYSSLGVEALSAYERLIIDVIRGDLTLFARQDGVEAMWAAVEPMINYFENQEIKDIIKYENYTWGPKEADRILKSNILWRFEDE